MPTLHPWQQTAADLIHSRSCIIADMCGLGKTYSAAEPWFREDVFGPVLIVCPGGVMSWWEHVLGLFDPDVPVVLAGVAGRVPASELWWLAERYRGFLIVHYEGLRYSWQQEHDQSVYFKHTWLGLVVDEAHRIRRPTTIQSIVVRSVRAHRRVALTGTPEVNHRGDYWALLNLIQPMKYTSYWNFYLRYNNVAREKHRGRSHLGKILGPRNNEELARQLAPVMLQRTYEDVGLDLAEPMRQEYPLRMPRGQDLLYQEAAHTIFFELEDSTLEDDPRFLDNALTRISLLRQLTSSPRLIGAKPAGIKLQWWRDWLIDHPDEPTVVFTWFRDTAHLLAAEVPTPTLVAIGGESDLAAKAFQEGHMNHFIGTYSTASEGLNLQRAVNVILYDPWWVGVTLHQAESRVHRLGQQNVVRIYRLTCVDTVDEVMWQAADGKWDRARYLAALIRHFRLKGGE